jgi:hypothetical protein
LLREKSVEVFTEDKPMYFYILEDLCKRNNFVLLHETIRGRLASEKSLLKMARMLRLNEWSVNLRVFPDGYEDFRHFANNRGAEILF